MRFIVVKNGTMHLEQAPLDLAELQGIVGGYFEVPLVYDGEEPETTIALCADEDGRDKRREPTAWVPELLTILVGPLVLLGVGAEGNWRDLTDREVASFRLVAVDGTPVPRLEHHTPARAPVEGSHVT